MRIVFDDEQHRLALLDRFAIVGNRLGLAFGTELRSEHAARPIVFSTRSNWLVADSTYLSGR